MLEMQAKFLYFTIQFFTFSGAAHFLTSTVTHAGDWHPPFHSLLRRGFFDNRNKASKERDPFHKILQVVLPLPMINGHWGKKTFHFRNFIILTLPRTLKLKNKHFAKYREANNITRQSLTIENLSVELWAQCRIPSQQIGKDRSTLTAYKPAPQERIVLSSVWMVTL